MPLADFVGLESGLFRANRGETLEYSGMNRYTSFTDKPFMASLAATAILFVLVAVRADIDFGHLFAASIPVFVLAIGAVSGDKTKPNLAVYAPIICGLCAMTMGSRIDVVPTIVFTLCFGVLGWALGTYLDKRHH